MSITKAIAENYGPLYRLTSDWGMAEWGAVSIGAVVIACSTVGFLNYVSSMK